MHVKVDRSLPVFVHDQVAAEIRRAIADGEAGPGDRLPLAKDLAAVLEVNKNTVLRAFHILRDEGLLDFTRGEESPSPAPWRRGRCCVGCATSSSTRGTRATGATSSST